MVKTKHRNKKRNTSSKKSHSISASRGFSRPFMVIASAFVIVFAAANIQITQNLTADAQNVLGEEEQSEAQKQTEEAAKEAEQKKEEAQKESVKQETEQQKEATKTITEPTSPPSNSGSSTKSKTETVSSEGLKSKTEIEGNKQETEIETAEGQKIKTKIEDDGTTKIEVENGTLKLKYRVVNGQVVLNAENEKNEVVEMKEDELKELKNGVEDGLEEDDVKLVSTSDNQLAFSRNQVAALTDFPLSINVETKELMITTPAGQKVVALLPDEAVRNLLATGIVNSIETPPSNITNQEQFGNLTGVVKIESRNNEIVYKIKGKKTHRILGIIPVVTPVTAFVSTDTGQTVAKQQSILTNVIDFLSP